MSVTNRLVLWWSGAPESSASAARSVFDLLGATLAVAVAKRLISATPIRTENSRLTVDEDYLERASRAVSGYVSLYRVPKEDAIEIARSSPLVEIDIAGGERSQTLFAEQQALPAERFNKAFSANPTLSLGPHDIWEWSMEAGNPPPVLYYGRAAVSLSLSGYGSPDMHPPEFCELLVNLPEMKKLRAELDAIFGESQAVYMVNS
jgi:hypothetical protein